MSTYTPIATTVLTSTASSVTFSSIPQNYTDLRIVISAKGNTTTGQLYFLFNNDTGSNYSRTMMWNNNAAYGSSRDSNYTTLNIDYYGIISSDRFNTQILDLMQYSNTNITKNCLFRNTNTQYGNDVVGGLWNNTSAITNIFIQSSTVLAVGSTFSLYGIETGGGYALGGDIVTTDGTYWYHAFTTSGAFTPTKDLTADVLIVAGGGGGGFDEAGGGGAGGLLQGTISSLTANISYIVTVGAGGANGSGSIRPGINGSNSVFSTHTAIGGGGGGGASGTTSDRLGKAGGSAGGGASYLGPNNGGTANQGNSSPLTGYGNNGGNSTTTSASGGGGGGAGAAGSNGSSSSGNIGKGGNGLNTWSSWASATGTGADSGYYAGGGGGTSANSLSFTDGGLGGGGKGAPSNGTATAGTANTGGGGGAGNGAGGTQNGASGGSGIVIVRYAV